MNKLLLVLGAFALAAVTVLLAEAAVRLLWPSLNLQGTDRVLFREGGDGRGVVLRPNAQGTSFGARVEIDAAGRRRLAAPARAQEDWLVIGDSVAFGVGVNADATFVGQLQRALPEVRILQTSVIGYSIRNYRDVLIRHLAATPRPARVLLFYCLNDVEGYLERLPDERGITAWLRAHSKLYVRLKDWFTDRSLAYFRHDVAHYESRSESFREAEQVIDDVAARCVAAGIPLDVLLLPYEVQLRRGAPASDLPQRLVAARFAAKGVRVTDLAPPLRVAAGEDSSALFLAADAMHFSVAGHRAVFRSLREIYVESR